MITTRPIPAKQFPQTYKRGDFAYNVQLSLSSNLQVCLGQLHVGGAQAIPFISSAQLFAKHVETCGDDDHRPDQLQPSFRARFDGGGTTCATEATSEAGLLRPEDMVSPSAGTPPSCIGLEEGEAQGVARSKTTPALAAR